MDKVLLTGITDQELLEWLAQGSRQAFDALYTRYWKQVLNQAYKRLSDTDAAQDITQEVFFQLWKRESGDVIDNLPAYLFVAVRNAVFKHLEKESKYESLSDVVFEIETLHAGADSNLLYNEFLQSFAQLIDSLPLQQRIIFRLRYDDGLNTQQIADQLQLSVKTVRNHLGRALATCRESLLFALLFFLLRR
ncbi:RNA polymerase sigma factor [Mucilaginibacter sp. UR6-11]|uniref:RNA polymerase sigma factor n=1 Tax=Mucilaginibacter sp. UR6-11 TaxID=1435644 RepID=UPI001E4301AC|nr:sigma-70 family RNA polymerase sigma factor [Mucilaginibacter sp. UR6-11]MCC8426488.1 sigma-70 family RNA polymerase sigma factor [Mucilaginibacter sp. UR6-11]